MAKRKSAIVEQQSHLREVEPLPQAKRRDTRPRGEASPAPAKAARRSAAASTVIPLSSRNARKAKVPDNVTTVAELAERYPSIAAFPGLKLSTAVASPPAHASPKPSPGKISVRQRLGELRGALAEGWEIVQPIFARPLWSVLDDSTTAFHFVLHRELDTRLVVVPEGRTVERFIRDRHLIVDYRR